MGTTRAIAEGTIYSARQGNEYTMRAAGTPLYYFQPVTGRRCSCYEIEEAPTSACYVCYGTGHVGGYRKYGTVQRVLDVTYNDSTAVNIQPHYGVSSRPTRFYLISTALRGYVQFSVELPTNSGVLDVVERFDRIPDGCTIQYLLADSPAGPWCAMDDTELTDRLGRRFWLRVELSRQSLETELPSFGAVRIRAGRKGMAPTVFGDLANNTASSDYGSAGQEHIILGQEIWIPAMKLRNIRSGDIFVDRQTGYRWYVHTVTPKAPLGIVLEWELQVRYIKPKEPFSHMPLGDLK